MGRIVVSENVSLDGVVQDPTGEEDFGRGGWFARVGDKDRQEWANLGLHEALGAEALLLGRRSYEFFAARWPSRSGEWADRLNNLPKYVVSSTLENPAAWNNSTVLKGDVTCEVSKLKRRVNGEIAVYASGRLVHTLMEQDLVDELRLTIYPFVVGAGERLFGETSGMKRLHRIDTRTIGDSLVFLTYQPIPNAQRDLTFAAGSPP